MANGAKLLSVHVGSGFLWGGYAMGNRTGIEWTDATWNPMTGCTKLTRGCDHCYAEVVAQTKTRDTYLRRLPVKDSTASRTNPFAPRFWPDRLDQPRRWREPRRIFVNSMSDVFHAHFSFAQIQQVFAVMNQATQHQFQVLTKRPERALRFADRLTWTSNIWMGTSIEDQAVARRADALRQIPAAVRFISAEPLLGPLEELDLGGIQWVIGGGESGVGCRPCDPAWARGLRDRCLAAGVAFFWKQWGGRTPKSGGRLLDGSEWNDYPRPLNFPAQERRTGSFAPVADMA
jgi:protein gp37